MTYFSNYNYQKSKHSAFRKNKMLPIKRSMNSCQLPHFSLEDHTFHFLMTLEETTIKHIPNSHALEMTLRTMNPQIPLTQITLNDLLSVADIDVKTICHMTITDNIFELTRYQTLQRSLAMEKNHTLA